MLPVLILALALILCSGVGWTVVSRLTARIDRLERNAADVDQCFVRDNDSIADLYVITESLGDRLLAHECKPSAAAHSPALVKRAPKKAATKAATPAKKATPRRSVR